MEISRERKLLFAWSANINPGPLTKEECATYQLYLKHFLERAEEGDTECQFDLGVKFAEGIFVPANLERAKYWWQRAAEGGDRDALECLANLYWLGAGVGQDSLRAFELMTRAAEMGSIVAQYEVARMSLHGFGTEKSSAMAFRWFHAAASNQEQGQRYSKSYRERIGVADTLVLVPVLTELDVRAEAQYQVAEALANGTGIASDLHAAKAWYEAAAARDHSLAQCELGMLLARGIGGKDMSSAVCWWERAACSGVAQAALNAAIAYFRGDDVPHDPAKAAKWARVAGEAGLEQGFILLGNLEMENGGDVESLTHARDWFVRAATAGSTDGQYSAGLACQRLGLLRHKEDLSNNVVAAINDLAGGKSRVGNEAAARNGEIPESALQHYRESLLWGDLAAEGGSEAAIEMIEALECTLGTEMARKTRKRESEFREGISRGKAMESFRQCLAESGAFDTSFCPERPCADERSTRLPLADGQTPSGAQQLGAPAKTPASIREQQVDQHSMNALHDRIIEGDGSSTNPFVIHTSVHILSTRIQNEILDRIFGDGAWTPQERRYYPSKRGHPDNEDLCEHVVIADGQRKSVWFDLYLVTKLVNDPALKEAKRRLADSPEGKRIEAELRTGLSRQPASKERTVHTDSGESPNQNALFWLSCVIAVGVGVVCQSFLAGIVGYFTAFIAGSLVARFVRGVTRFLRPKPVHAPAPPSVSERKAANHSLAMMFRGSDLFLNDSMQDRDIVLLGRESTLTMSGARFLAAVVSAKMRGWEGGKDWFFQTRNGLTAIELESNMKLSTSDATSLAASLRLAIDESAARDRALDDLRPLRDLAEQGGFSLLIPVATYHVSDAQKA